MPNSAGTGSPNYIRGIYNASSLTYPAVMNGSLTLQYLLEDVRAIAISVLFFNVCVCVCDSAL